MNDCPHCDGRGDYPPRSGVKCFLCQGKGTVTTESKPREWELELQAPEVLAILAGRQTQLRIPMWIQPNGHPTFEFKDDPEFGRVAYWPGESEFDPFDCHCPAGNVGDRIWVKEEWALYQAIVDRSPSFSASGEIHDGAAAYRADGHVDIEDCREHLKAMIGLGCRAIEIDGDDWKPASEMPRWASRIELEGEAVRIERLQDITDDDIELQGIEMIDYEAGSDDVRQCYRAGDCEGDHPRPVFMDHWNGLHLHDTWYTNPYVWVVTFKKIHPEPTP